MRQNQYVLKIGAAVLAAAVVGCGGYKPPAGTAPVSGIKKRVLISNVASGSVNIMDAQKDVFSASVLTAPGATKIVSSGGFTAVLDTAQSDITVIDNTKETAIFRPVLTDQPVDVAISTDGKTAWAAERSFGFVQQVDTATGTAHPNILVPSVTRLVMGPNGKKLLAFSNDPQANVLPNTDAFFVIDTASGTVTHITAQQPGSQPYTAVFDPSDTNDTTAFILFCGTECGGTTSPGVSKVNFNAAAVFTPAVAPVAVFGATVGLLSGGNLYVAGTPVPSVIVPGPACPLSRCGTLQIINTGSLTASTPPVRITDGVHRKMALTSTNRLYVGASACTTDPGSAANTTRGCLTIFNTGSSSTKFPEESSFRQNFDVTGLQTISGRNAIYICQGGELDIFDTSTDAPTPNQLDVVGKAMDVVQIDP